MSDELDTFIQQHKAKLAQERQNLHEMQDESSAIQQRRTWQKAPVNVDNGYKENVPPRSPQEVGLVAKMGENDERRRRLREERNFEYNQMLRQQQQQQRRGMAVENNAAVPVVQRQQQNGENFHATLPGLGNDLEAQRHKVAERNREYNEFLKQPRSRSRSRTANDPELDEFNQWSQDRPPPPRKGWATPTYEEILNKKRQEERSYRRRVDSDVYDRDARLGDSDYTRNSISDGQLNRIGDRDGGQMRNVDDDYASRRVKFVPDNPPYLGGEPQPRRAQSQNHLDSQVRGDSLAGLPPRSQRPGKNSERFNATLLIGKETRESEERRKKAEYREELKRQMAEAAANKQRDKAVVMGPSSVDDVDSDSYNSRRHTNARESDLHAPSRQLPRNTLTQLSPADDFGLQPNAGYVRTNLPPVDSVLNNGLNFDPLSHQLYPITYPAPTVAPRIAPNMALNMNAIAPSSLVAAQAMGPGMTRSPLDDAYYYYGLQHPLDPGISAANPPLLPVQQPAAAYSSRAPPPPANFNGYRPEIHERPADNPPQRAAADPLRGLGEVDDKKAAEEKKRLYQLELQRQMEEDKLKKLKAKQEQEAYDRKLDEEIKNYNPYGRGGAGAPMRDAFGNIISQRKGQAAAQQIPQESSRQMPPSPPPQQTNRYQHSDPSHSSNPYQLQMSDRPNGPAAGGGDSGSTYARGGHGIFGEPMTDEQKNAKMKYQDDLRQQIEERKQREREEKERAAKEEELLMKRIEEENRRLLQQAEEEERKKRDKEAQEERRKQEVLEQQERMRKEAEQKRKEAQEARAEQSRKQEEERRRQEEERQKYDADRRRAEDRRRPESRAINGRASQNSRLDQNSRFIPPPSPPAPKTTNTSVPPARAPSAEVMNQLARMKEQLRSERRRVESDLNRERMEPVVFDPRLAAQEAALNYDVDVVQTGPRRPAVARRALPERGRPQSRDSFLMNDFTDGTDRDDLERQQRTRLAKQEEHLRDLKRAREANVRPEFSDAPPGRHSVQGRQSRGDMLDSESAFLDIPPSSSRAELRTDLEDYARHRNNQSRNRRRQRLESNNPMGSLASLNPDELGERNQDRLRRLKSLAGDDISTEDPDTILEKFMSKVNHNRPPSNYTLDDDSWLQASGR